MQNSWFCFALLPIRFSSFHADLMNMKRVMGRLILVG